MQRSSHIDFCKGILILLVSIGHAAQCAAYQEIDFFQDPTIKAIYMFHMPLFMAISGYVSFPTLSTAPPLKFVYLKSISFLTPIFVWEILFRISSMLISRREFNSDLPYIIISEAMRNLWFLWALLASLILTTIAHQFGKFSALVSAATFIGSLFFPDQDVLPLFKYTFPFFLIGYYLAAARPSFSIILLNKFNLLISGIASVILFYLWKESTYVYVTGMKLIEGNMQNILLRYVAGIIVSIFALCLIDLLYKKINSRAREIIILFGKNSLYIYIISQYAFIFVTKISSHFFQRAGNHLSAALIAFSVGILITAACSAVGRIVATNRVASKLLFGKTSPKK